VVRCRSLYSSKAERDLSLQGVIRGKPIKTTLSDMAAPFPLEKVNWQHHVPAPNML
jgi:hypothetical protein